MVRRIDAELLSKMPAWPEEVGSSQAKGGRIDFSPLSDKFASAAASEVKRKSRTLPTTWQITRHDAFHVGAKDGTGAAAFYNLWNRFKAFLGFAPKEDYGKLADIAKVARNDARALHGHIVTLDEQFDKVLADKTLSNAEKRKTVFMSLYFLETCHDHLAESLDRLKLYEGLTKANPHVGYAGVLVAGKTTYVKEKTKSQIDSETRKVGETAVLTRVALERQRLNVALSRLKEAGLEGADYLGWKHENAADIEISLNRYRGAGAMTGITIQGLITASINFGVGAATLNPIVFAAGAYYVVSTAIKVAEVAAKTGVETRYIEATHAHATHSRQMSQTKALEVINIIHEQTDSLANTTFGVAGTVFTMPVTMGRPAGMSEVNVGAARELSRIERKFENAQR